jgi:signal transduction histidine kinase
VDEDQRQQDKLGADSRYLQLLAHDLRSSLNTILGWTEVLRTGTLDEAGRARAVQTILRHARQHRWLTDDLEDACLLLSGALRMNTGPLDVAELVESAVQAVEPFAQLKQVTVSCELAPVSGHVVGDAERLKRAIFAVLSAALYPMTTAGTVGLRLASSPDAAELTVFVADLGARAGDSASVQRPTGRHDLSVRLHLARELINLHGGALDLSSELNALLIRVSLPLVGVPRTDRPAVLEGSRQDS